MKVEQIITDEAINIVFENTRFGDWSPREVIADTLAKTKEGYASGRTAIVCCMQLGLIQSDRPRFYELSVLGEKYLELINQSENKEQ